MANCDSGCTCVFQAGPGVTITGAGTIQSPFRISADLALAQSFRVQDTDSVDMRLVGSGTPESPFTLSATASLSLQELTDVDDPIGPVVGDVPVWVGTGLSGHWEFQPPPASPPGAVNVGAGIVGNGSAGSPIAVALVGTSAGGSVDGLEVYVDSSGNLRAVQPQIAQVTWANLPGKPSQFPPTPHTHPISDITGTGSTGVAIMQATSASAARTALGAGAAGSSLFTAATAAAARSTLELGDLASADTINLGTSTVTGTLPLARGGLGATTKTGGRNTLGVFVQSSTPSGAAANDLWFW